jgi:hypothetical protein
MADVIALDPRRGVRHNTPRMTPLQSANSGSFEQYSGLNPMADHRKAALPPAARNLGERHRRPDGGGDAA